MHLYRIDFTEEYNVIARLFNYNPITSFFDFDGFVNYFFSELNIEDVLSEPIDELVLAYGDNYFVMAVDDLQEASCDPHISAEERVEARRKMSLDITDTEIFFFVQFFKAVINKIFTIVPMEHLTKKKFKEFGRVFKFVFIYDIIIEEI